MLLRSYHYHDEIDIPIPFIYYKLLIPSKYEKIYLVKKIAHLLFKKKIKTKK
jgi:hypothetical protein